MSHDTSTIIMSHDTSTIIVSHDTSTTQQVASLLVSIPCMSTMCIKSTFSWNWIVFWCNAAHSGVSAVSNCCMVCGGLYLLLAWHPRWPHKKCLATSWATPWCWCCSFANTACNSACILVVGSFQFLNTLFTIHPSVLWSVFRDWADLSQSATKFVAPYHWAIL